MHALHFAIKGAARAKHIGDSRIHWWTEAARPFAFWINTSKIFLFDGLILFDLLQLLWTWLGKFFSNCHSNAGILCRSNGYFLLTRHFPAAVQCVYQIQSITYRIFLLAR